MDLKRTAFGGLFEEIRKISKSDVSRFRLSISAKMAIIPLLSLLLLSGYIGVILNLNFIFFDAYDLSGVEELREAYYDFILSKLLNLIPYIVSFLIVMVIIGLHISDMLLRPFRLIGEYCERRVNSQQANYDPGFFTELKLLTGFSEFFFSNTEKALKDNQLAPLDIPARYMKIHKPVFEKAFFIQYSLFILISALCAVIGIHVIGVDVYEHIIALAKQVLKTNTNMTYFLTHQAEVFEGVLWSILIIHTGLYLWLSFHLYSKVAPPAFGIFATMRSFLKGQYGARVHLIGHYYVRSHCRNLNRYLDLLQKKLTNK